MLTTGSDDGVMVPVVCAVLLPHELFAVTVIAPACADVPAVTVIEFVPPEVTPEFPPPEVMFHPVGIVHV